MLYPHAATEAAVQATAWELVQQIATFIVALGAIWATMIRPWWNKREKKRAAETAARDARRRDEIAAQINDVVAPLAKKVDAIHHTTTVNGGKNNPPTFRDEVSQVKHEVRDLKGKVKAQGDTQIRAIGAVAVNQAVLAQRFDEHVAGSDQFLRQARAEFARHGIHLPDPSTPSRTAIDDDQQEEPDLG